MDPGEWDTTKEMADEQDKWSGQKKWTGAHNSNNVPKERSWGWAVSLTCNKNDFEFDMKACHKDIFIWCT